MLKIGHRGAKGYEPENTLKSIQKAIDLGVDMVEFDVQICKSGEAILMHDELLTRTTNGHGKVKKTNWSILSKLKIKKDHSIPLFHHALDLINKQVIADIELKGENTAKTVVEMIHNYIHNKGWHHHDFMICSFIKKELVKARQLDKHIAIGVLVSRPRLLDRWSFKFAKKINATYIIFSYKIISKRLINKAHNNNLKVFAYTINKKDKIEKLKKAGIDGIISDFPDRLN